MLSNGSYGAQLLEALLFEISQYREGLGGSPEEAGWPSIHSEIPIV